MPFIYKEAINFQDFNYFGKHKSYTHEQRRRNTEKKKTTNQYGVWYNHFRLMLSFLEFSFHFHVLDKWKLIFQQLVGGYLLFQTKIYTFYRAWYVLFVVINWSIYTQFLLRHIFCEFNVLNIRIQNQQNING